MMKKHLISILPSWLTYPVVMASGLLGYLVLQSSYPGEIWIAYVPVLISAILITIFEIMMPYQVSWKPGKFDIKNDLAYMLLVQVSIPLLIGLTVIDFMYAFISDAGISVQIGWPHDWPLLLQAALLLLLAEFVSYWVHRFAHQIPLLWRFHAVHHSSEKLYWLNVGRFHPFEKTVQYMVSTAPFILIGVNQDVVGLYLVFYGINGFFQHSNIDLRFGILNYLVSSAELHRWHHSPKIEESNNNYGNNLIIWDLVFGTRYLPKNRKIKKVSSGIQNYPQSFMRQLVQPFTRKTTKVSNRPGFIQTIMIQLIKIWLKFRYWRPFMEKAKNPAKHQKETLQEIMRNNKKTDFGREYKFSMIVDEAEFEQQVPIMQYEDIRPYIEKKTSDKSSSLYSDDTLFYARTSGTTGAPKDIPITRQALKQFKRQQRLLASYQYQLCADAFSGKALAIVSPAVEGYLENGMAYGSVSGHMYKTMPAYVRERSIVPPEVFEIEDYDIKYRIIVRLALAEENITYLVTANPSTFLRIRDLLNSEWEELLKSLENGQLQGIDTLPDSLILELRKRIQAVPARAEKLRHLNLSSVELKDVWPDIRLVTTWTGGNCEIAVNQLTNSLPDNARMIELGYVATEIRGSITCDQASQGGLPILDQIYYEFIEKEKWDSGDRKTLKITELQEGKKYYVIVTTNYGLYRYFMNDLVEVVGRHVNTPLIKFLQKGDGVTNITGEKVYEAQINEAIQTGCKKSGFLPKFQISLANVFLSRYEVYIETQSDQEINSCNLSHFIDEALSGINIEYHQKRKSGRLTALRVYFIKSGTGDSYKLHHINHGQREGQYKCITLLEKRKCTFPLKNYISTNAQGKLYGTYN